MSGLQQASTRYISVQVRESRVASRRSSVGPLSCEDAQHAFATLYGNRELLLLFTVVTALMFALMSWLIAGPVVRPIVSLADSARLPPGRAILSAGFPITCWTKPVIWLA